jgi:hypothetical protein
LMRGQIRFSAHINRIKGEEHKEGLARSP